MTDIRPNTNIDAERACLGGMLISRDVVDDVMREVTPRDFYLPKHETVYRAITTLHVEGKPTDVIAVQHILEQKGEIERAGGPAFLHELAGEVVTAANAPYQASLVREAAIRRRLTEAGLRITGMGQASEGELDDLLNGARAELDRVDAVRKRGLRTIGESLPDLADTLDAAPQFVPTPWESLDRIIGGFAPGNLVVVAARPGDGKSIFLLQVALKLAHQGMVAFSSLEMTEPELQLRMVAQYGEIHMTTLRNHALSQQDWHRFMDAKKLVAGAPVFVDDTPRATIGMLRSHLAAVKRRGPLSGFCVDYLQLVKATGADRRLEVEAASAGLVQMAKDFQIPVVAAAQLRRPQMAKGAQRPLPTLSDLREAGGIEQDAAVVILLHRDPKTPNVVKLIVAKNRHGETKSVDLVWQGHYSRLVDKKWTPTSALEGMEDVG